MKAFLTCYCDERQIGIPKCYETTIAWVKEHYPQDLNNIPSERTFRRQLDKIPESAIALMRYGEKYYNDKYSPYIMRIYDELEANDCWIADNHTFDFFITGEDGKPHRPYLTAFMDAKSGVIVGFCITDNPCSQATLTALRDGILKFGLPKQIYVDNGSEFLTHDIGGRGHRKKANWNKDKQPPTILDILGIKV